MTAPHCVLPDYTLPHREQHAALASGAAERWPRRILVAIDGTVATDPAIRAARAFARRAGSTVDVAAVFAPRIPVPYDERRRGIRACERGDRSDAARLISTVRGRFRELVPERADRATWRLRLEVGDPGATLIRLAAEVDPELVIVGIAQREPLDALASGRTAVCAARYLDAALFAASPEYEVPSRVIVALPSGKLHGPTLCAALASVVPPAKLWLVFPERHPGVAPDISDAESIVAGVRAACGDDMAHAALDGVRLERIDVEGDMLSAVLRLADELSAQLIAIPNHGDPGPVRSFLPNLAEPLLLSARCSVLVVPDLNARDAARR
jgi:nucleotide-binding universal stress UspA family protein